MSKTVTIKLSANNPPSVLVKPLEIIKTNGWLTEEAWGISYAVDKTVPGEDTVSIRRLNTSRWKLIRKIELAILKKLLTIPKQNVKP